MPCDFLTINPYFGEDSVKPFIESCEKNDKGLFVLVKTSNKSSADFQEAAREEARNMTNTINDAIKRRFS